MSLITVKLIVFKKWKRIFEFRTSLLFFVDLLTSHSEGWSQFFSNEVWVKLFCLGFI